MIFWGDAEGDGYDWRDIDCGGQFVDDILRLSDSVRLVAQFARFELVIKHIKLSLNYKQNNA